MTKEEFMIGDLVQSDLKTYYKVKGVSTRDGGEVLVSTGAADMWYERRFIEPIPITPEILEKNKFALDEGWYVWNDGVNNNSQVYVTIAFHRDNTTRHIEIKTSIGHTNYNKMKYVHELQQALRLCGLKDLADNFKI